MEMFPAKISEIVAGALQRAISEEEVDLTADIYTSGQGKDLILSLSFKP